MNRLREKRVVKRITQFKLRLATGIHQSRISLIENGLVQPRADEINRLAEALDLEPEELFKNEDHKFPG